MKRARYSIVTQLVFTSLSLFLVLQLIGFSMFRQTIEENAMLQASAELTSAQQIWKKVLNQNGLKYKQAATVLASDYGLREAIGSRDMDTIRSVLENHSMRVNARVAFFYDTNFKTLGAFHGPHSVNFFSNAYLEKLPKVLAYQGLDFKIIALNGQVYQMVLVPVKAPVVVGWVMLGFPVDTALAQEVKDLTRSDVVLFTGTKEQFHIYASTLKEYIPTTYRGGDFYQKEIRGEKYVAQDIRVDDHGLVSVQFLRALDDFIGPYDFLQFRLILITVFGLLLFVAGNLGVAAKIVRPLRNFVDAAKKLARGEYDGELLDKKRQDEIGELAEAFDDMRTSIGEQQRVISKLAYWDTLTQLPNREKFKIDFNKIVTCGLYQDISLVAFDLDRFKNVNDILGYQIGDKLLQKVTARIQELQSAQGISSIFRLGGNTFILRLDGKKEDYAFFIAQLLAQSFERPIQVEEHLIDLSAGIGIACWPQDGSTAEQLISRVEIAMLAAKQQRQAPVRYRASLDSSSALALSLLGELRRALDQDELRLFLQPKLNLHTGAIIGAEALVRWQHSVRGLVPPFEFIPFAEQTGFIKNLTFWMFEQAVIFLSRHVNVLSPNFKISVNLSTRDLMDIELTDKLDSILKHHGVPAHHFCLEITESAMMDDPSRAFSMLEQLAAYGFTLSIDDFGTGYSSLGYLKQLPVNELKIDKSFVMNMETHSKDANIVRLTIDLAHHMDLQVVAEGVENKYVLEQLKQFGCDEVQGYYIQRPIPSDDFLTWFGLHHGRFDD